MSLAKLSPKLFLLLCEVDRDREDDQEEDVSAEPVLVVERVSHGHEPLYGYDHQPDHGHGYGDVLDGVGEVGYEGVEPLIVAHGDMTNNNIVEEIHEN